MRYSFSEVDEELVIKQAKSSDTLRQKCELSINLSHFFECVVFKMDFKRCFLHIEESLILLNFNKIELF